MILTTHALAGAVIGKYIDDPLLIVLVSLVVHYSMDSIRHAEYFDDRIASVKDTWWKVAIDICTGLGVIFLYLLALNHSLPEAKNILLGAFFSMFPDLLTVIHWKFKHIKVLAKIKAFHAWAHCYGRHPKYSPERQWNLKNSFNDVVLSLLAIVLLFL
jgi:hypothetical protein